MKKYFGIAIGISIILFIIPFFWLKPGFVDLGGDAGRLYFIDPMLSAQRLIAQENLNGVRQLSLVPYQYFLYIALNKFVLLIDRFCGLTLRGLKNIPLPP